MSLPRMWVPKLSSLEKQLQLSTSVQCNPIPLPMMRMYIKGPLNYFEFKDERVVSCSPSLPFLQVLSPRHLFLHKTH